MSITVHARFKQRRRTPAAWTALNEILYDGELGVEEHDLPEPDKFKFGDGVTPWNSLPYSGEGAVLSVAGKTGAVTLVKADVGLGSVDDTSDLGKPISTATQTALDGKANNSRGTWTPVLTCTTTPPTLSYTRNEGTWEILGKTIRLSGEIEVSTLTAAGSGYLQIGGFPTAPLNARYVGVLTPGVCLNWTTRRPTGGYVAFGVAACFLTGDNGATATSELTEANLAAGCLIVFTIEYDLP